MCAWDACVISPMKIKVESRFATVPILSCALIGSSLQLSLVGSADLWRLPDHMGSSRVGNSHMQRKQTALFKETGPSEAARVRVGVEVLFHVLFLGLYCRINQDSVLGGNRNSTECKVCLDSCGQVVAGRVASCPAVSRWEVKLMYTVRYRKIEHWFWGVSSLAYGHDDGIVGRSLQ